MSSLYPVLAGCLGLALVGGWSGSAGAAEQRMALLVGSNDGGPRRALLRFAQSDAEAMARVLVELGGVAPADQFLLRDPTRAALEQALRQLEQRVLQVGTERAEVVIYYSGHSDHEGLLLGSERFAWTELRSELERMPARVRVSIVDSCSSGAMVRDKGGRHRPPLVAVPSSEVRGYAMLTSASADEAAQESDHLGSSFFTHHLVSGLRGAADSSGDGLVSLNEAYHYAFHRTLAGTERTSHGPQHPAYDMRLVGTGDLVLTDVRQSGAALILAPAEPTRGWVRDDAGRLMAELEAEPQQEIRMALAPGAYTLTLRQGGQWAEVQVRLQRGDAHRVEANGLTWRDSQPVAVRGDTRGFFHWPLRVNTLPARGDPRVVDHVALNLLMGRSAYLQGLAVGLGGSLVERDAHGAMVAVGTNLVGGSANGFQLGLGLNRTGGHVRAWQFTLGANLTGGYLRGFQLAGGLDRVRGPVAGFQLAGGLNLAGEAVYGMQLAGGANRVGGELRGVQVAGGVNRVVGRACGVQLGLVNVAESLDGVQLGLVNHARHSRGVQVGLVNAGTRSTATVGLISIHPEGRRRFRLGASLREPGAAEVQLGGHRVYDILGFGLSTEGDYAIRWGLGTVLPFGQQRLSAEAVAAFYGPGQGGRALLVQPRLTYEHPLKGPFHLFAGPSWDLWIPWSGNQAQAPGWFWWGEDGLLHGPGLMVGVGG